MAAGQNCLYGSLLSPPRQQQVREACKAYWDNTTMEQDAVFQMLCGELCKQAKVDVNDPEKVKAFYNSLREHPLLWTKGEKARRFDCPSAPRCAPPGCRLQTALMFQASTSSQYLCAFIFSCLRQLNDHCAFASQGDVLASVVPFVTC